jgi:replicative DNA helicase
MAVNDLPQIPDAPASIESEKALLGSILIDDSQFYNVATVLKADDFFLLRHKMVYEAMQRLASERTPIDTELLGEELDRVGKLQTVGGYTFLAELSSRVPTSQHAEFYAHIVARAAYRRRLLAATDKIRALALNEAIDSETVQAQAFAALLSTMHLTKNRPKTMAELIDAFGTMVEEAVNNPRGMLGNPGALTDVAYLLRGCQPGKFDIVAGRPGMGKSAYLLSNALALSRFFPVLLFTLEMPSEEVLGRILSAETGLKVEPLLIGRDGIEGYKRYLSSVGSLARMPLLIDDTADLSPAEIEARIQVVRGETNGALGAVFIDYLQLINARAEIPKQANREQEISYISRRCKVWAKSFGIFVQAASQLSRAVEARADKRPLLSDLRESGSLEQDADIVELLYRHSYYRPNEGWIRPLIAEVEVNVAKHRGGRTGLVHAAFDLERQRFVGLQRPVQNDNPQPAARIREPLAEHERTPDDPVL